MGIFHCDFKIRPLLEMTEESRTKNSDYCRSPNLGSRSPSLIRSKGGGGRNRDFSSSYSPNRYSDSEYTISPQHFDCRVEFCKNERRNGISSDDTSCKNNGKIENKDNMALNAIMVSGGGNMGIKKATSQRTLSDSDCEHTEGPEISVSGTQSDNDLSRSWAGSSRCNCDRKTRETVIINVGGHVFETFRSTLKRLKSCKLANEKQMMKYYRPDKGDFFFDRDPYAFNIIMNYLRYGDLHLPTNLCGPALMREFQYWGVDEGDIERCCFQPYNTWKTQTKSLEKLEYDRKQSTTQTDLAQDRNSKSCWRRLRAIIWTFLQDPGSSLVAKIYAWVSIIFVCLSIFSFCAETHPIFKLPPSEVHNLKNVYKFFALEDSKVIHETQGNSKSALPPTTSAPNVTNNTGVLSNETDYENEGTVQHPALLIIDLMCVLFFSLEFVTRLVFCPKKLRFCSSLQNIIDFIAIVPDYVEFILLCVSPQVRSGLGFVDFIFILRMLRLCRIFRLIRHVPGLWILLYTLKASFNELLLMFVFLLIGMVMFASLLHFTEGGDKFSNIPVGFWWAVVTMTTVGYGDMVPKTAFGYVIGSICAISGLLMIAFTVPIIVSNFVLYYTHVQYGISDKDEGNDHVFDINDEIEFETCSLRTACTDSSDLKVKMSPQMSGKESETKSMDVNEVFMEKFDAIPLQSTDGNSNNLRL